MIILNAMAQLAALAGVVIIQIAYSVAAARLLGVAAFGQFSFVFSITQILLIGCDLGFHNTALRKIAFYTAERQQAAAEEVFRSFFFLKILVSLALVGCAAAIAAILPENSGTGFALMLFAGGMFFQSLNMALNVTFQSRGQLYLGSLNNVVMAVLN